MAGEEVVFHVRTLSATPLSYIAWATMTSTAQWIDGARPRTLPAAVSPVLVGTGVAIGADDFRPVRALLALVVALALQVGVNYANDYSDGVRGTDARRVGPMRLVGSGAAPPATVRRAAFAAFAVAAVAGLVLAASTSWLLLLVGAAAIVSAWTYTGGPRPYGYAGFGEVFVFVFFGLVAVVGTAYVQTGGVPVVAVAGGVASGLLAVALLITNNLRDLPSDRLAGKHTLSVRVGERVTRALYAACLVGAFVVVVVLAPQRPAVLAALVALPLAVPPVRTVARGASGPALLPVLRDTGRLHLVFSVLLAAGLAVA
jgi:1,4-dihydroxy-2-naphthoate octaprenyltransferase